MSEHTIERPTLRQLRLMAWMRNPSGPLPTHPAINWRDARWTAAELVQLAGVHDSRRACLSDLHRLHRIGHIERLGNRWSLTKVTRLAVLVLAAVVAAGCAAGNAGQVCTAPGAADCPSDTGGETTP